ncbi:MAG: hypothetical protein L6R41_006740 [Letrouitia leprolyta]|nr:MAG: hypothetical protein L6R41_006740 [Letrouitia leprolyta]
MRDQCCQITSDQDQVERAHLCPREEHAWFQANNMKRYNRNQALPQNYLLDDGTNGLALRPDVHDEFDDAGFIFTRKQQNWVVHFLRETHNLRPTYHNRKVNLKAEVSAQFLLARFAWAILPLVRPFVNLRETRVLYIRASAEDDTDIIVKELDIIAIQQITLPKKSRQSGQDQRGGGQRDGGPSRRRNYRSRDSGYGDGYECSSSSEGSPGNEIYLENTLPETLASVDVQHQQLISPPDATETEEVRLNEMRMTLLKKGRVTDPNLLCCEYNEAEERTARGLPGKRKQGGAYLCLKCLGEDYQDEDLPPLNNDEVIEE